MSRPRRLASGASFHCLFERRTQSSTPQGSPVFHEGYFRRRPHRPTCELGWLSPLISMAKGPTKTGFTRPICPLPNRHTALRHLQRPRHAPNGYQPLAESVHSAPRTPPIPKVRPPNPEQILPVFGIKKKESSFENPPSRYPERDSSRTLCTLTSMNSRR